MIRVFKFLPIIKQPNQTINHMKQIFDIIDKRIENLQSNVDKTIKKTGSINNATHDLHSIIELRKLKKDIINIKI